MTKLDWQQVKDLFAEASEQPGESRLEFLRVKCNDNDSLYDEVSSLLAASSEPENLIENNVINLASKVAVEETSYAEQHFGNYRIIREIGSGGMGTVFLATRDDGEFSMQVALKIVRQSVADREIIERFKRERQILANLNHPNIAALHDGGISEKGEPYIAMEYVEGETLTDFCEKNRLTIPEKLRLFLKICAAVAYAHRNLVVHRDIKPSNILVTPDHEPKLLDFGLAKAFEADISKTQTNLRAFTPAYASPEQINGKNITTASDVYSLGVIFYELISNSKPFLLDDKSFDEIIQTINNSDPLPPSRMTAQAGINLNERQIKGDLDNIALMALRKEPDRRYASVEEFAEDVRRHLDGRPVIARQNTLSYRGGKFIRRNKMAVAATALIAVAVIGGLSISLWQANRARRESSRAKVVNQSLRSMLTALIPENKRTGYKGAQTTLVDILRDTERRLVDGELDSEPDLKAEIHRLVGEAHFSQGNYDDAEANFTKAFEQQITLYGADSLQTLETELDLASLYLIKADYDRASEIYQRREGQLRAEFQANGIDPEIYFTKMSDYAVTCRAKGESDKAESLLRSLVDEAGRLSRPETIDGADQLLTLIMLDQGRIEEAKALRSEQVSSLRRSVPEDDPSIPPSLTLYGSILMENGEYEAAEKSLIEAGEVYRKLFGPDNTATFDNLRLQAQVSYLKGDYQMAKEKIDRVLENYRKTSSPKYISFATALTVQGLVQNKLGNPAEADRILREALRLRMENLPASHFMTALTQGALGEVLLDERKTDEAEPLIRSSYASLAASQKTDNERLKLAKTRLDRLETVLAGNSAH